MALEGQQLGQYHFGCLLTRGGMAEVYLAKDVYLDRQVAIKVIWIDPFHYSDIDEAKEVARLFLREARVIAQLDHIHILPLYDSGEGDIDGVTFMFMVMPLRSKGSLAGWLQKRGPGRVLSPKDVEYIVRQAASALQYAHNHGIIHRDVKPSNFLLQGDAEQPDQLNSQLADFGVAKLMTTTSESWVIRGTPIYMAPEQWEGRAVPATDQYALAVMAYELLTGCPPFEGKNHQELWYQHYHTQPQPPSTINPDIPEELDAVLLRALTKNPEDRFRSVSAFANTFRRALSKSGNVRQTLTRRERAILTFNPNGNEALIDVTSPPDRAPSPGERYPRQFPGRRFILLSVALALLLMAASIGLFYFTKATPGTVPYVSRSGTTSTTTQANLPATASAMAASATASGAAATASATAATATTIAASAAATATASSAVATATAVAATATVTAYQSIVEVGKLALNDSLQDNNRGYQWDDTLFPDGSGCAFIGKEYHDMLPGKASISPCFAQATDFSNFSYQIQVRLAKGDRGGIIFRADSGNETFYCFSIDRRGGYGLAVYKNATLSQVLKSGTNPAIKTDPNQANLIAVVANGNTLDIYVNMQHIVSVKDSTYDHGEIGVFAQSTGDPTDVIFSDAQVWSR